MRSAVWAVPCHAFGMRSGMDAAPASVIEASPPPRPALNPLTRRLLEGSIAPLILRLGWPNMLIMFVQAATSLLDGFAGVIRGTGNMLVPALVTCGGVLIMLPLSPCLIFGLGPFPQLGIAGSALSLVTYYLVGTAILLWYIASGRCIVSFARTRLSWSIFASILSIGALGAIISLQMNLTAAVNNA